MFRNLVLVLLIYGASAQTCCDSGIRTTGTGSVTATPDKAEISIGITARAQSVASATSSAAVALTKVLISLERNGVKRVDAQTQQFNISPEYNYISAPNPFDNKSTITVQQLLDYAVLNQIVVTVRNISSIGAIIDGAVTAGGDLVTVNSISFAVAIEEPFRAIARNLAVKDALSKAASMASSAGTTLGALTYLVEDPSSDSAVGRIAFSDAQGSAVTPILGGALTYSAQVSARFDIQDTDR